MSVAHTEQLQDESDGGNTRSNTRIGLPIDISRLCLYVSEHFIHCVANVKHEYVVLMSST